MKEDSAEEATRTARPVRAERAVRSNGVRLALQRSSKAPPLYDAPFVRHERQCTTTRAAAISGVASACKCKLLMPMPSAVQSQVMAVSRCKSLAEMLLMRSGALQLILRPFAVC